MSTRSAARPSVPWKTPFVNRSAFDSYPPFRLALCIIRRQLLEFKPGGTMWISRVQVVDGIWKFGHTCFRSGHPKSTNQAVTPVMSPQIPPNPSAKAGGRSRYAGWSRRTAQAIRLALEIACAHAVREAQAEASITRPLQSRHAVCCHRHLVAAPMAVCIALTAGDETLACRGCGCRTTSDHRIGLIHCSSRSRPAASWMHVAVIGEQGCAPGLRVARAVTHTWNGARAHPRVGRIARRKNHERSAQQRCSQPRCP